MQIKILALSGGSRRDSLNQKLLNAAARGVRKAGADVAPIRFLNFALPIYDGDLERERGLPAGARALRALVSEHHALLIATPEHNGGYTALLKNAIDPITRPKGVASWDVGPIAGKIAALVSASPGSMGGLCSQIAPHIVLHKVRVLIVPESYALSAAHHNDGYTIEWLVYGVESSYNNIHLWQYGMLQGVFVEYDRSLLHRVETMGDLDNAFACATRISKLHFIEVPLPRLDAPESLMCMARREAECDVPQMRRLSAEDKALRKPELQ